MPALRDLAGMHRSEVNDSQNSTSACASTRTSACDVCAVRVEVRRGERGVADLVPQRAFDAARVPRMSGAVLAP